MHTNHSLLSLSLAMACLLPRGPAQNMVTDINNAPMVHAGSDPGPVVGDGPVWFAAWTAEQGRELWISDLTTAGTRLVADLWPGRHSSDPDQLVVMGGVLYFAATGPDGDRELYRSDGTATGTYRLHDLQAGSASSAPQSLTVVGNTLYFSADDGVHGRELWRSQGATGTQNVLDLRPGSVGSDPRRLTKFTDWLLFAADDGTSGQEPWISDGTATGTFMLADVRPGPLGSMPRHFTPKVISPTAPTFFREAWFSADSGGPFGRVVWTTNGTSALTNQFSGTPTMTAGFTGRTDVMTLVGSDVIQGGFACSAQGQFGRETFVGGGWGSMGYCDLLPGPGSSLPSEFLWLDFSTCHCFAEDASGDHCLFEISSSGGITSRQLWSAAPGREPHSLTNAGFVAWVGDDGVAGEELWRLDSAGNVPSLLADICPGPAGSGITGLRSVNNRLVFTADDGVHGRELWCSDGTAAGTFLIRDIALDGSYPQDLVGLGRALVFTADDGVHGRELWVSDGTATGTALLADIESTPGIGAEPSELTVVGDQLFCAADDGTTSGRELYVTDGTTGGTRRVRDIHPGPWASDPRNLVAFAGMLMFVADDGSHGRELWSSDGATAGTQLFVDLRPGQASADPTDLVVVGDALYFVADDGVSGRELWRSDGTAAGTRLVLDIHPGSQGSAPSALTAWNGALWFAADDGTGGVELWRSTGTAGGTARIADLWPGAGSAAPTELTAVGSLLFFVADDGIRGRELYCTDGTAMGTGIVKDLFAGAIGSDPGNLVPVGDRLVFAGTDAIAGRELYSSDGTTLGTSRIHDFAGAASGIDANRHCVVRLGDGDMILFGANDGVIGNELWSSDGSSLGTRLVADLRVGADSGLPANFLVHDDSVWFTAADASAGVELFRAPLANLGAASHRAFGIGCANSTTSPLGLRTVGASLLGNGAFGFELMGAAPGQPAAFVLGLSETSIPLLGCAVLVNPMVTRFTPCDALGHAVTLIQIPSQQAFVGFELLAQALTLPIAVPQQLVTTGGLAARIGR